MIWWRLRMHIPTFLGVGCCPPSSPTWQQNDQNVQTEKQNSPKQCLVTWPESPLRNHGAPPFIHQQTVILVKSGDKSRQHCWTKHARSKCGLSNSESQRPEKKILFANACRVWILVCMQQTHVYCDVSAYVPPYLDLLRHSATMSARDEQLMISLTQFPNFSQNQLQERQSATGTRLRPESFSHQNPTP